jgi:hypothetical protein
MGRVLPEGGSSGSIRRLAVGFVVLVATTSAARAGASPAGIADGAYRRTVTAASLEAAGVGRRNAHWNSGVQTLVFKGSRWTTFTTRGAYHAPACSGDLTYSAKRVTLTADRGRQCGTASGGLLFSARWSFADGEVRFTAVRAQPDDSVPPPLFGGGPWRKIR